MLSSRHFRHCALTLVTLGLSTVASTLHGAHPGTWHVGQSAIATPTEQAQWSPERRGSANDTLSGGRRGGGNSCAAQPGQATPRIQLLVPNETAGLVTTAERPTFSWYLETPGPVTMTFVLQDPAVAEPVVTQTVQANRSGLVNLEPLSATPLKLGTRYRWSVLIACGEGQQEIVARSFVERVQPGSQPAQYQSLSR